jgi:hypothetical protein
LTLLVPPSPYQERIKIEHTEKKPIFSTHSLTGKKLTSALAHHRGKAHKCTLRVTSSEDTQRTRTSLTRPSALIIFFIRLSYIPSCEHRLGSSPALRLQGVSMRRPAISRQLSTCALCVVVVSA